MNHLISIQNLSVNINNKNILNNINLSINQGEVHAIMGPNGSGKSTLANTLARNPDYLITDGSINFLTNDLTAMTPELAALNGIFLSFQNPIEIPGVTNINFIKTAVNALRKARNEPLLDAFEFLNKIKDTANALGFKDDLLYRHLNDGFSGGEKKRNEILQLCLLEPKLAILDEIDSGLDIDALSTIATVVNNLRHKDTSIILITHYQRILNYIKPDFVHIMHNGTIVKSGDYTLAIELEKYGFAWALQ